MSGVLPIVVVVVAGLAALWWLRDDGIDDAPNPVSIEATGPTFTTIDELVAASDLIVEATVVDVDDGRTITDPTDPASGILTQLARVEVDSVLAGTQAGPLVVEQEASLLDGTPLVVNGVAPLVAGDTGLMFLIRGDGDEFPYTAFVNEQGWVPIVEQRIAPIDPRDAVWADFADRSSDDLIVLLD